MLLREFADSQLSADLQWLSDRTVALQEPDIAYNDLAQWHYADLPKALGCDNWFTARVTTCKEFDQALETVSQGDRAAYVEVVTEKYVAPPLSLKLHESVKTLYRA